MSHSNVFQWPYVPQSLRKLFIHETVSTPISEYPPANFIEQVAQKFTTKLSASEAKRFNGRLERGLHLALDQAVNPEPGSSNRYLVHSATGVGTYLVDLERKTCDCPDSLKGNTCKHRIAAYYFSQAIKLQKELAEQEASASPSQPTPQPSLSAESTKRESQILKEMGYEPEKEKVREAATPIHRLGSLYSRYLHGSDLDGKSYRVTVKDITLEKVMPHPSQPQEKKWCLWVTGLPEGLPAGILFGVRGEKDLLAIFGRVDISTLKGKQLVIYPVTTSVAGQNTVSIRFRSTI